MMASVLTKLWPFPAPNEVGGLIHDAAEALYWSGARDGAVTASIAWIALILVILFIACLCRKGHGGLALSVFSLLVGIVLWYGGALRSIPTLPAPPSQPNAQPTQPDKPRHPLRPWKGEVDD
jgi:hypothetical protein